MAESSSKQTYKRRKESETEWRNPLAPRSPTPPPTIDESIPPSSSIHVRRFSSPAKHLEFVSSMGSRKVLVEREFVMKVLRDVRFEFLEKLEEWGWVQLLNMKGEVYPNLVKLFYFNGDCTHYNDDDESVYGRDHKGDFKTTVLGQTFVVDEALIRQNLEVAMKEEGARYIEDGFNYENACAVIYNQPNMTWQESNINLMSFHVRLLHLVLGHSLLPKGGSYADLTKSDKFFLSKVLLKDPPNLPALMVRRMIQGVVHCKTASNKMALPYAILVSRIIKKKCGGLVNKQERIACERTAPFNLHSVGLMGYKLDKATHVVKKKPKKNQEPLDANPPQDNAMFMGTMMDDMRQMHEANMKLQHDNMEEMRGMFARMETRYETQEAHLLAQDAQILYLHNSMRAQANNEPYDFPFPTYQPPPPPNA